MRGKEFDDEKYQELLKSLQGAFPGKFMLSVEEVAQIKGDAVGTVYNRIGRKAKKPYPVRFVRSGGRPKALVHDVAQHLASL